MHTYIHYMYWIRTHVDIWCGTWVLVVRTYKLYTKPSIPRGRDALSQQPVKKYWALTVSISKPEDQHRRVPTRWIHTQVACSSAQNERLLNCKQSRPPAPLVEQTLHRNIYFRRSISLPPCCSNATSYLFFNEQSFLCWRSQAAAACLCPLAKLTLNHHLECSEWRI